MFCRNQRNSKPNCNRDSITFHYKLKNISINKLFCKDYNWIFIEQRIDTPSCIQKWSNIFNNVFDRADFENVFQLAFRCSLETKLQSFQFKLIHRILANNSLLFKMKIKTSPMCIVWSLEETLQHKFFYCEKVFSFWHKFKELWNALHIQYINEIRCQDIILGFYSIECYPLNFCILLGKYYIYCTQLNTTNQQVNFVSFKKILQRKLEIMQQIFYSKQKLVLFDEYFSVILQNINSNAFN